MESTQPVVVDRLMTWGDAGAVPYGSHAEITATQPIAVERAMYRSGGGQVFSLGHDASAVAQPATIWMFTEGATGAFFDTYLLLANPRPSRRSSTSGTCAT